MLRGIRGLVDNETTNLRHWRKKKHPKREGRAEEKKREEKKRNVKDEEGEGTRPKFQIVLVTDEPSVALKSKASSLPRRRDEIRYLGELT